MTVAFMLLRTHVSFTNLVYLCYLLLYLIKSSGSSQPVSFLTARLIFYVPDEDKIDLPDTIAYILRDVTPECIPAVRASVGLLLGRGPQVKIRGEWRKVYSSFCFLLSVYISLIYVYMYT
jgi:hypothetical protein